MNRNAKRVCAFCAAVFFLVFLSVLKNDSISSLSSTAASPAPSPETERFAKFYLGTWEYTETYEKTPFAPQGGVNTGIYSSELGPGGNSLVNRFHSKGPIGDFEGLLMMTWDPKEKAYKSYVFGNDFPGAVISTGNFE